MSWIKEIFRLRETINRLSYRIRVMEYPHTINVGDVVKCACGSRLYSYHRGVEFVVCDVRRDECGLPVICMFNIRSGMIKDMYEGELELIKK